MNIRLDKYLADSGYGTRTEVKSLVKSGVVSINGTLAKDCGQKINTDSDTVSVRGVQIGFNEYEYYMLHKPGGIITASRDKKAKTVLDLVESKKRRDLFPVGRLDKDTEGLLVITNDGDMSHRLLSPKKHVSKTYVAFVSGVAPEDIVERFEAGLDIGDEKLTKPAKLNRFDDISSLKEKYNDLIIETRFKDHFEKSDDIDNKDTSLSIFEITITEGRYHEIKRMFEAVGCEVVYLKRYSMGELTLDFNLKPGEYRRLTEEEVKTLKDF